MRSLRRDLGDGGCTSCRDVLSLACYEMDSGLAASVGGHRCDGWELDLGYKHVPICRWVDWPRYPENVAGRTLEAHQIRLVDDM